MAIPYNAACREEKSFTEAPTKGERFKSRNQRVHPSRCASARVPPFMPWSRPHGAGRKDSTFAGKRSRPAMQDDVASVIGVLEL